MYNREYDFDFDGIEEVESWYDTFDNLIKMNIISCRKVEIYHRMEIDGFCSLLVQNPYGDEVDEGNSYILKNRVDCCIYMIKRMEIKLNEVV